MLAISIAIAKAILVGNDDNEAPSNLVVSLFVLLPMVDLLLFCLLRLRIRERRTPGAIGFVIAGTISTAVCTLAIVVARDQVVNLMRVVLLPVYQSISGVLSWMFGNATLERAPFSYIVGMIGFELVIPSLFFCVPILLIAWFGAWIATKFGRAVAKRVEVPVEPTL